MRFGAFAKGRTRCVRGSMNGQEREYAAMLNTRKLAGEVLWVEYEPMRLRIAEGAFYAPDFGVMLADGTFEFHEVKGWMERAAHVRIKVAADKFPFRFVLAKKRLARDGGGWSIEVIGEDAVSGSGITP